jgi:Siphovirus Gp157
MTLKPMSKSLFDIADELRALEGQLTETEDPQQQDEIIQQFLTVEGGELATKLDNYAELINELEAIAKARKEQAKKLTDLAKANENRAIRLRANLLWFLEQRGVKCLETQRHSLSISKAGGKRTVGYIDNLDPATLPEKYQAVKVEIDKEAVRADLESGEQLPFAVLGDRQTILRIK